MAHRVISLPRGKAVAFGLTRTPGRIITSTKQHLLADGRQAALVEEALHVEPDIMRSRTTRMRLGIFVHPVAGLLWLLIGAVSTVEAATCAVSFGTGPNVEGITAFHAANDGALLFAATSGVFRLDGDRVVRIGGDQTLGAVYPGFYGTSDGTLLIGTTNGVFRRDGDRLVPVGQATFAGRIMRFYTTRDGTLLVGTGKGVFRRDGDNLVAIGQDQNAGAVQMFVETHDGTLLVGTETTLVGTREAFGGINLFRRDGDKLIPIEGSRNSYIFFSYLADDGTLLLGGGDALYRLDRGSIVRIGADEHTGQVTFFHKTSEGSLLIGGQAGLFRREGDSLFRITDVRETGRIIDFLPTRGDAVLIVAERGVFRLRGGDLARIGDEQTVGRVRETSDGTVLVGGRHGLLRLDDDRLVAIGNEQDTGPIGWMQKANDSMLVFAQNGLFRLAGGQFERIEGGERVGTMAQGGALHIMADGALLVGSDNGLFRLAQCS
jgi:hypothetical protein